MNKGRGICSGCNRKQRKRQHWYWVRYVNSGFIIIAFFILIFGQNNLFDTLGVILANRIIM